MRTRALIFAAWPLIAGMICMLIAFGAWDLYSDMSSARERTSYQKRSTEEKIAHWKERVLAVGGKAAYAELAHLGRDLTVTEQHTEGHLLGRALYGVRGTAGIGDCSNIFMYSCYHEIAGQAIRHEGMAAAQKLHEACLEALEQNPEDCEHGVGHGIQTKFPYDEAGLVSALKACDALVPPSHPVAGCAGGVFMEFNMHTMSGEGAGEPRQFEEVQALEPCASLSPRYRGACALWQTQWWVTMHPDRGRREELADRMGTWCRAIPGGEPTYKLCLEGITRRMKTLTNGNPEKTNALCNRITAEAAYRYQCQRQSALRFAYYYPIRKALSACDGLPSTEIALCREATTAEDARLTAHQAKYR